ncbi:MAG: hypothetical protein G9473_03565 [Erythrobacter sp.]|nr:MAG: hypothetical protein G9473_03565 [Erythrobacter sp.]
MIIEDAPPPGAFVGPLEAFALVFAVGALVSLLAAMIFHRALGPARFGWRVALTGATPVLLMLLFYFVMSLAMGEGVLDALARLPGIPLVGKLIFLGLGVVGLVVGVLCAAFLRWRLKQRARREVEAFS